VSTNFCEANLEDLFENSFTLENIHRHFHSSNYILNLIPFLLSCRVQKFVFRLEGPCAKKATSCVLKILTPQESEFFFMWPKDLLFLQSYIAACKPTRQHHTETAAPYMWRLKYIYSLWRRGGNGKAALKERRPDEINGDRMARSVRQWIGLCHYRRNVETSIVICWTNEKPIRLQTFIEIRTNKQRPYKKGRTFYSDSLDATRNIFACFITNK
jgi:hypothetical protein